MTSDDLSRRVMKIEYQFCRPEPEAQNVKLARVLGSVLTFLQETRMLPNDQAGGYIEQLKVS